MTWYMVFGSKKRPKGFLGGSYLDWSEPPIGVYQAENPEEACKQAANDSAAMGTFFAVEGYPWGLELMSPQATQLGRGASLDERLGRLLDQQEETQRQIDAAKVQAGTAK